MAPIVPVLIGYWCFSGLFPLALDRDRVRATVDDLADRVTDSDDQAEYDRNTRGILIVMLLFAAVCGPWVLFKYLRRGP
jgi:hypothetical protein